MLSFIIVAKKAFYCRLTRRFFHTYKTYPTTHNLERLNNIANLSKCLIQRDYKKFIDSHICQKSKWGELQAPISYNLKISEGWELLQNNAALQLQKQLRNGYELRYEF